MDSACKVTARKIVKELRLEDKAKLLSQIVWETTDIKKIHEDLKKFLLADGPAGIRRLKDYFDDDIYNTRPSTCYPSPSTYASSWNRELLYRLGEHMGREARQEDVDTMLAPAVNIKRSPLGGRNFEYYSEDPYLTGELATEFIKGIQTEGVGACLKHFAANNQETRRMNINAEIEEETLQEVYLSAFEKPVKEGRPKMVMMGYNQLNGEFCASNPKLLQILRKDWGYEGVVVTDCYAAHRLGQGIRNGLTLQMPGEGEARIVERVLKLIHDGEITEAQLDEAVQHNIVFALEAGAAKKETSAAGDRYDRNKHHAFARELAEESMVLLQNKDKILPLDKKSRILVTGELAIHPRFQGGGSSHVNPWKLEIPLEELQKRGTQTDFLFGYKTGGSVQENENLCQEVLKAAVAYDTVVVFAGLPDLIESEGYDRDSMKMPAEQNQLIEKLTELGGHVVVVLANGSVVEMPWRKNVEAILESYLGGESGASAIAEILFGEINPSGKLAETFPVCLEDNPSYLYFPGDTKRVIYGEGRFVGYKQYEAQKKPLAFPFGHGLSYTEFEYAACKISKSKIEVTIKNSGERQGKEIIQVYVKKHTSKENIFPIKLAGFEKILLEPGEERIVSVELDEKAFMRYQPQEQRWNVETGVYEISVGRSVQDIRYSENITIQGKQPQITEDSSIGDMIRMEGMYERLEQAFQRHPVSLGFLEMTKDEDPLKSISMGALMTFNTLKRVDETLQDSEIEAMIQLLNSRIV
ncbi:MAG: glycoside hydrolase family 3 C-terminal domain-containing protein [Hespellia sp.]|nr:glycoside hydrolase family 3 C-terminal domain-containing protein [Hespellia sp.]